MICRSSIGRESIGNSGDSSLLESLSISPLTSKISEDDGNKPISFYFMNAAEKSQKES